MRIVGPILFLLLAACQDRTPAAQGGSESVSAAAEPSDDELLRRANDPARVQALVERAMATIPDAAGARYRNLRAGAAGAACGEVAFSSAPFRPFVVTPDGVGVIAAGTAIAFSDPDDITADAWIRWCATPEELAKLGPRLDDPIPEPGPDANIAAADFPTPLEAPSATPPEGTVVPPPLPPSPAKTAPPPEIDSFFNSVQRRGD